MNQENIKKVFKVQKNNENMDDSINVIATDKSYNRVDKILDNTFAYDAALNVLSDNSDVESRSVKEMLA